MSEIIIGRSNTFYNIETPNAKSAIKYEYFIYNFFSKVIAKLVTLSLSVKQLQDNNVLLFFFFRVFRISRILPKNLTTLKHVDNMRLSPLPVLSGFRRVTKN